jgi:hypothetical protein
VTRAVRTPGPPAELAGYFAGRDPDVYRLYRALLAKARSFGRVTVVPEKARIVFRGKAAFMALAPRQMHLIGHFVFPRRVPSPRFQKIETTASGNHLHHFCVEGPEDLDDEFAQWIADASAFGREESAADAAGSRPAETGRRK